MIHDVNVENIGSVYWSGNQDTAKAIFNQYVLARKQVTWTHGGELVAEYYPFDDGLDYLNRMLMIEPDLKGRIEKQYSFREAIEHLIRERFDVNERDAAESVDEFLK